MRLKIIVVKCSVRESADLSTSSGTLANLGDLRNRSAAREVSDRALSEAIILHILQMYRLKIKHDNNYFFCMA